MQGSKKKYKATSVEPSFSAYEDIKDVIKWTYWGDWGEWHKDKRKTKSIQMEIILKN